MSQSGTEPIPCVFVVDDDASIRTALKRLFQSVGLRCETFSSAQSFLTHPLGDQIGCLVLDVRLPGLSGLDLQSELSKANIQIPIIFITGHGDVPMTVRAIKAGAVEFLTKPFHDQDLLDAVQQALNHDHLMRQQQAEISRLRQRLESLTPREHQVMGLVVFGFLNKQIAGQLGTSEKTVKVHRGQVMQKMETQSLPELVRIADKLGMTTPKS
jgi:FixJ family two-component response regulator